MGVYIKGMEMPTSCGDCPIGDALCCSLMPGVPALWKEYTIAVRTNRRHSDCPLVPVPPHGRLIDEEVVLDHFVTLANIEWNQNVCTSWANAFAEAASDISDIPTVIPADKDGET